MIQSAQRLLSPTILIFLYFSILPFAIAGDMMNVDFLEGHALKSDPQVQAAQAEANQILYDGLDADADVTRFNLLATGLYTATFYVHGPAEAYIGSIAGLVEVANIMLEHIRPRRDRHRLAKAISILKTRTVEIQSQVKTNYDAMKTGSVSACEALVHLAGPDAVAEVQQNLRQQQPSNSYTAPLVKTLPCF